MFTIRVEHVFLPSTDDLSTQILAKLDLILGGINALTPEMTHLLDEVTAIKTADESLITLTAGIKQQLDEATQNATDFADLKTQVAAVADDLGSEAARIAAAVTANTDAAPTPPVDVPPTPPTE